MTLRVLHAPFETKVYEDITSYCNVIKKLKIRQALGKSFKRFNFLSRIPRDSSDNRIYINPGDYITVTDSDDYVTPYLFGRVLDPGIQATNFSPTDETWNQFFNISCIERDFGKKEVNETFLNTTVLTIVKYILSNYCFQDGFGGIRGTGEIIPQAKMLVDDVTVDFFQSQNLSPTKTIEKLLTEYLMYFRWEQYSDTNPTQTIWDIDCVADVSDSLDGTYFKLEDDAGTVGFWIDTDDSGTTIPAGASACDRAVEITTIATDDTAATIAGLLETAIHADSKFSASSASITTTVTSSTNNNYTSADAGDSGFTITVTQAGISTANSLVNFSQLIIMDETGQSSPPEWECNDLNLRNGQVYDAGNNLIVGYKKPYEKKVDERDIVNKININARVLHEGDTTTLKESPKRLSDGSESYDLEYGAREIYSVTNRPIQDSLDPDESNTDIDLFLTNADTSSFKATDDIKVISVDGSTIDYSKVDSIVNSKKMIISPALSYTPSGNETIKLIGNMPLFVDNQQDYDSYIGETGAFIDTKDTQRARINFLLRSVPNSGSYFTYHYSPLQDYFDSHEDSESINKHGLRPYRRSFDFILTRDQVKRMITAIKQKEPTTTMSIEAYFNRLPEVGWLIPFNLTDFFSNSLKIYEFVSTFIGFKDGENKFRHDLTISDRRKNYNDIVKSIETQAQNRISSLSSPFNDRYSVDEKIMFSQTVDIEKNTVPNLGSITYLSNMNGNCDDESGLGNDGTTYNGNYDSGNYVISDETGASAHYLRLPNAVFNTVNDFTIYFENSIADNATGNYRVILSSPGASNWSQDISIQYLDTTGQWVVVLNNGADSVTFVDFTMDDLGLHKCAVTRTISGSDSVIRLFIDDTLHAIDTITGFNGSVTTYGADDLLIGATRATRLTNLVLPWYGLLRNLAIFENIAFSESEIKALGRCFS